MRKYSLTELLDGEIAIDEKHTVRFAGVQIPMIQRDYAQGRKSQANVRDRFLKALFKALNENADLTLDFVYGSVQRLDGKPYFIPLDGQQRLTTLFLLHWYIGSCELIGQDKAILQARMRRFSYATRRTARDFCAKLASQEIGVGQQPSKVICNQSWFYSTYQQDPTVQAMLEMLDAIQLKYSERSIPKLFPQLSKLTFYVLPLDGFGLSDELYIKMNARGKQLTGFENFKADLIDWLRRETNPHQQVLATKVEYANRQLSLLDAFCIKLDAEWMDLFWQLGRQNQSVDATYMLFWHRFLLAIYFVGPDPAAKVASAIPFVDNGDQKSAYLDFTVYEDLLTKPGIIQVADRFLDKLAKHYQVIGMVIADVRGGIKDWHPLDASITPEKRILFLAILCNLRNDEFNEQELRRWLRVVWNMSMDPGMQNHESMIRVMQVVEKLSKGASCIYDFLQTQEVDKIVTGAGFIKRQLAEERLKAGLIQEDAAWEEALIKCEHHPLFQGKVGFLLSDDPSLIQFQHRALLAEAVFSAKGAQGYFASDHRLLRAAISCFKDRRALEEATMQDDAPTWRSWLRESAEVQELIVTLLDLDDHDAVAAYVDELIAQPSVLAANDSVERWRYIHRQLFSQVGLLQWMQRANAIQLKWFAERIFVCRSGSWYDWVAIDTYSNFISAQVCDRLGFTSDHRIAGTDYFTGRHGVTLQRDTYPELLAHYNNDGEFILKIRKKAIGDHESGAVIESLSPKWEIWKTYPHAYAVSQEAAEQVVEEICQDVHALEMELINEQLHS